MYDSIINEFNSFILNNKVSHAYLIEVNNYDEDLKVIYNFIKMIISNKDYQYVSTNNEDVFKQIDDNNYVDLYVIEAENGKVINKNQILKLQDEMANMSFLNNKRIYIIKECEKLNGYSANTLLKFLEEPSDNIIGFLLTSNRYKVIDTIISRCQILKCNCSDENTINDSIDELVSIFLNPKKYFLNYDYFISNYFSEKAIIRDNLGCVQKYFINEIANDSNDKDYLITCILTIEEDISKLDYNVNLKLWCDSLISKLLEEKL